MKAMALGATATAIAILAAAPAGAHHSGTMYDTDKAVNLTGTVREFQWTNPHSWLQLVVDKPGGGQEWSVELAAPGVLTHRGWKPKTFKPGDKLSVVVHPMKDGTPAGNFVTATLADGTVINTGNGSGGGVAVRPE